LGDAGDVVKCILELGLVHVAEVEGEVKLGADFAGGAGGYIEKMKKLVAGAALEAFGDVGDDGYGGAADLVAEAVVLGKGPLPRQGVDFARQAAGSLPDFQIFELLNFRHVFQRSND